ncbi:GGDEF domain-containing protein [Marinomonas colpomeniae]|uniref:GGDEF domain-containing protein n=1 Tax=Marinomonas colpomeniae TaxID=2774408 RepID=A0ABR8NU71_9GAMM|nr:GGDEF domain-containing protein [Marinomonas colpomeniae]MBD5769596.1 GGDEF domain-containing protein [Marinomonas colpomeniae]
MSPLIRHCLRKLGRVGLVATLTVLSTILAYLLNFFLVEILGFTYIPFEDFILVSSITVLVTPLLSWYLVGLFFKLDEMEVKMTQLATIDSLTNTYNRGYFYEKVEQFLSSIPNSTSLPARAEKLSQGNRLDHGHLPGFFILDLDNLKPINDQYGHAAGDKVLAAFSSVLLELAPEPNVVGRLGGDEFVVFLHKTTQIIPQDFAEQILERVRSANVEFDGCPISFAASIGFSNIHGSDSHAIDMAMKAADNALYKVKRSGRNGFAMGYAEH